MEGNKAGPHCIAFGVRGREELACLNNNKDGKKNAPLRGHLRGAHFVFVLTVGWKNGGQSRRGNIVQVGDLSLMWLWKILWWRSTNASADSPTAFCGFYPISDVDAYSLSKEAMKTHKTVGGLLAAICTCLWMKAVQGFWLRCWAGGPRTNCDLFIHKCPACFY